MAFIVLGVGDTKMPKTMGPTYKELDIQCQVAHPKGKTILTGLAHHKHMKTHMVSWTRRGL